MCHLVLSVNQRPLDLIRAKEHLDVMRATWVFASLLFGAATFVHLNPSFSEEAIESLVDSALSQDDPAGSSQSGKICRNHIGCQPKCQYGRSPALSR